MRVRDLHRAGTHEQHRCIQGDVRDLQQLRRCLLHRHGICVVRCEDLAAEERTCNCCDFIFMYVIVITEHATVNADTETAVLPKDNFEDDDDRKTGPRFFKKE